MARAYDGDIVICYIDGQTGVHDFQIIRSHELTTWQTIHPTCIINHAFRETSCLLNYADTIKNDFYSHLHEHNLPATYLGKRFRDRRGHVVVLKGYSSASRKYKCIVFDETEDVDCRVTINYINNCRLLP